MGYELGQGCPVFENIGGKNQSSWERWQRERHQTETSGGGVLSVRGIHFFSSFIDRKGHRHHEVLDLFNLSIC